jgi:hypothetical protein
MYEYYPFSPHTGVTIVNVFILLFSSVNDNFEFSQNYYYYHFYHHCEFFINIVLSSSLLRCYKLPCFVLCVCLFLSLVGLLS